MGDLNTLIKIPFGKHRKKLREKIYNLSLTVGLFYLMPIFVRMPEPLMNFVLKLRALIRFTIGSYRAYVNRNGLKQLAVKNLSETLGLERRLAIRKVFRLMQLEVIVERNGLLLDKYKASTMERYFCINGLNILDVELRKQKGIIFTTIHSGDTLLLMLYLSFMGYNIYGLFDGAIENEAISKISPLHRFAVLKDKKITGRIGKIYMGKGTRKIFDVLYSNGIIVWMVDLPAQNKKREKIVNFLGTSISVSDAFWHVAKRSGASIIPHVSIYNFKMRRHDIYIGYPIDTSIDTIQKLFDFYEPYVRQYPESWLGWYYLDMMKKLG